MTAGGTSRNGRRLRLLCTNDDGIHARGISVLAEAAAPLGETVVVAPDRQQSATSHSLTLHRPLRVTRSENGDHVVDGTPTDCVLLAVNQLLEERPDFVLSGVNHGPNMGEDVLYSGTVAAAMEAAFIGVPAIAVSLHIGDPPRTRWDAAARHARQVIERLMAGPLEPHSVLNVNVPILDDDIDVAGTKVVPISTSPILDRYDPITDPSGDTAYKAMDGFGFHHTPPDSDVHALFDRFITVTPLHFDLTLQPQLGTWTNHLCDG